MRWTMDKLLLLTVVANLLLGLALLGLRSPVRAAPGVAEPRPALPAQFRQLQARIDEGRHDETYSLTLTDADLTAAVGYFLASRREVPFARVHVTVAERNLVLDGVTRGLALTLPVRVTGAVGARGGKPWARVEDVSLGDTQVPAFVRDQIVVQANAGLDLSRYDLAVTVDSLELRPGAMTVRGRVR